MTLKFTHNGIYMVVFVMADFAHFLLLKIDYSSKMLFEAVKLCVNIRTSILKQIF